MCSASAAFVFCVRRWCFALILLHCPFCFFFFLREALCLEEKRREEAGISVVHIDGLSRSSLIFVVVDAAAAVVLSGRVNCLYDG